MFSNLEKQLPHRHQINFYFCLSVCCVVILIVCWWLDCEKYREKQREWVFHRSFLLTMGDQDPLPIIVDTHIAQLAGKCLSYPAVKNSGIFMLFCFIFVIFISSFLLKIGNRKWKKKLMWQEKNVWFCSLVK